MRASITKQIATIIGGYCIAVGKHRDVKSGSAKQPGHFCSSLVLRAFACGATYGVNAISNDTAVLSHAIDVILVAASQERAWLAIKQCILADAAQ